MLSRKNSINRLLAGSTAALALSLVAMSSAQAQTGTSPRVVLPASVQAQQVTVVPVQVDESALYYYAQNNQHARVDAEVRRLSALHPGWAAPADLYHGGAYNRDQQLWDLFASQEIAAIHDEIARRAATEPGWQPPLELMQALERVELRRTVLAAAATQDTGAIIATLQDNPALLDSQDLEVLWAAGAAYAKEQLGDTSVQMFDIALRASETPDELAGTLYNARDALPAPQVATLMQSGQSLYGGQPAYTPVFARFALDLHRDALGAQLETWRVYPDRAHALDRQAMAAIQTNWTNAPGSYANSTDLAGDYELVGWAYYALGERQRALDLFQRTLATAAVLPETSAARYGAALSLRDLGNVQAALDLLEQGLPVAQAQPSLLINASMTNSHTDDRAMALYIELLGNALYGLDGASALSPPRVARHTHYVGLLQDADGAQALGWYAYRSDQLAPAAAWFAKSMEWRPSRSAAEGLVRSTWRQGERDAARTHLAAYQTSFPDLQSLESELTAPPVRAATTPRRTTANRSTGSTSVAAASQAQRSGNPRRCLTLLEGAGNGAEVTLIRAWCMLDLGRPHEAALGFSNVQSQTTGTRARDAGYGHALAMLRQGRTFDALAIARDVDLSETQRATIARSALADQANQAFNAGHYGDAIAALDRRKRFAAETRDLALLRGWALVRLNAPNQAREIFAALDRQLSTRETQQGLAAVPNAQSRWMNQ